MQFGKILGAAAAALLAATAHADGVSAAHQFFNHLDRTGAKLSVNEASARTDQTLVRGIYRLNDLQGRFVGFINEAGTLFGDARGFTVISAEGEAPRPLARDERTQLQAELLGAIDFTKLPKVTYGNGGGRRLVLFSAVDCGYCRVMEANLRKYSANLQTTIYVLPASLHPSTDLNAQGWQTVSRIWCDPHAGSAWLDFWASQTVPPRRECAYADPRAAEAAIQELKQVLQAAGLRVTGTPTLLREDGAPIGVRPDMDATFATTVLGPAGAPARNAGPAHWLTAATAEVAAAYP